MRGGALGVCAGARDAHAGARVRARCASICSQGARTCSRAPGRGRAPCFAKTGSVRVATTPARRDRHGRTTSNERGADCDKRHRVETRERQAGRRCCHGRCRLRHDFAEHCDRCDRRSNGGLRGGRRRGRIRGRHRNACAHECRGACHAPHDKCPSYVLHFVPPRNTAPMNSHFAHCHEVTESSQEPSIIRSVERCTPFRQSRSPERSWPLAMLPARSKSW